MDEEERVECPLGLTREEKRNLLLRAAEAARVGQEEIRKKAKEIRERQKDKDTA